MKILFVDNSPDLQQTWIEPLRKKGWGVVRARSAEDATRMMTLHGDGLEAIAVSEKLVGWAEKQEIPFLVLTTKWTQNEILKHQNSANSAIAYLPYARGFQEVYHLFEARGEGTALRATGTQGISLQDYSEVLSKPEPTRAGTLQLVASEIALGGAPVKGDSDVTRMSIEPTRLAMDATRVVIQSPHVNLIVEEPPGMPEVQEINLEPEDDGSDGRTTLIEPTRLDFGDAEDATRVVKLSETRLSMPSSAVPKMEPVEESATVVRPAPVEAHSIPVINQFSIDPSPSAQVSDVGTLKSYLALREQDVAVLSGQVRSSQERIQQLEMLLKVEKARSTELSHMVTKHESRIKNYDQEKQVEFEVLEKHVDDVTQQLKERTDKVRTIEAKLRLTLEEVNKVKERVRVDIRRIRVREKELEGQLEILKKDSSALLQARDEKIVELKRKLDLLEFNMELVQEQYSKERKNADELKNRLKDAANVMNEARGLLEQ